MQQQQLGLLLGGSGSAAAALMPYHKDSLSDRMCGMLLHQSLVLADEAGSTAWTDAASPTKHATASAPGWWPPGWGIGHQPGQQLGMQMHQSMHPGLPHLQGQAGLGQLLHVQSGPAPHVQHQALVGVGGQQSSGVSFLVQLLADFADHPC